MPKVVPTCIDDMNVRFDPFWNDQTDENTETNYKQIPLRVEIHKLKIGQSNSSDHSKHDNKNTTNDRFRDGGK